MERTNNKLNLHIALTPGFEAGQHEHWWETRALTTAPPSLLAPWLTASSEIFRKITQKNSKNSNFILNLHHRGLNRPFLEREIRLLSLHLKEQKFFFYYIPGDMFSRYIMVGSDDVCLWPLWKITGRFSTNRNSKRIYLVFDVGRQKMIVISKLWKERLRVSGAKPKRSLLKILWRK